jgi:hypothetical protein
MRLFAAFVSVGYQMFISRSVLIVPKWCGALPNAVAFVSLLSLTPLGHPADLRKVHRCPEYQLNRNVLPPSL